MTSLDAARILQHVVNPALPLPVVANCGREWAFVPAAAGVPNQRVVPPAAAGCHAGSLAYEPLVSVAAGQDFLGVVYGDLTGNWTPLAGGARTGGTAGAARVGVTRYGSRGKAQVPIYADGSSAAMELTLWFDPSAHRFLGLRRAGAAVGGMVASHERSPGEVRVAVAGRDVLDAERPSLVALFEARRRGTPPLAVTVTHHAEVAPRRPRTY